MHRKLIFALTFIYACSLQGLFAFPDVTEISESTVDSQALTIDGTYGQCINGQPYQQEAVITHNGYQYVGYYNDSRHICLARRELPSGAWDIIEFTDYYFEGDDAHNVIVAGICPNDGTIHLAFDHHGDTLNYRVSEPAIATDPASFTWSTSLFSDVRDYLKPGETLYNLTYPNFFQTPDGDLQFRYRYGGSGDGVDRIVDYDGSTGTWGSYRTYIKGTGYFEDQIGGSSSRNAYPNLMTYGPNGKLHVSWVWRESAGGANHDLMYAYSDDGGYTWYNGEDSIVKIVLSDNGGAESMLALKNPDANSGVIADTAKGEAITLNSPGVTAVNINRKYGLMNQHGQTVDSQGRVHTVVWHCTDETLAQAEKQGYYNGRWGHATARRYHHYWRDTDGVWHHNELPWVSGNRARVHVADNGDAFLIYGACQDPVALGNDIYFAKGTLTIAAATEASGWSDWQIIYEDNSNYYLNEMLTDPVRFEEDNIISVMVQQSPSYSGEPTPLKIIEFQCN